MSELFVIESTVAGEPVRIMTHLAPHFEDLLAVYIVREYGTTEFLNKHVVGGEIEVGCGGGALDDHAQVDRQKHQAKKCAALLVAEALGVDKERSLRRLLTFALFTDRGEAQNKGRPDVTEHYHPLTLDQRIKEEWRDFSESPEDYDYDPMVIVRRALDEIRLFHREQIRYWKACDIVRDDKYARQFQIPHGDEDTLRVVMVWHDNCSVNAAARSQLHADIVVQFKSDRHVQIHTRKRKNPIQMRDVARVIRMFEQEAAGEVFVRDWGQLGKDGNMSEDDRWFLTAHSQLLNGSESYVDVTPTSLSDEQIERALNIALRPDAFGLSICANGSCGSTRSNQCPVRRFGLSRCKTRRYEDHLQLATT